MWVVRDKDEDVIWLFEDKPQKIQELGIWLGSCGYELSNHFFPKVSWEDEEPTEVEVIIKKLEYESKGN